MPLPCYFIAAHQNAAQVLFLLDAIFTGESTFVIHVDRRSDGAVEKELRSALKDKSNVHFLTPRSCNWGSWGQIETELEAIKCLLTCDAKWDHYINLSGQDYPLAPPDVISSFLRNYRGRSFMEIDDPSNDRTLEEYEFFVQRWNRYHLNVVNRRTLGPIRVPLIRRRMPRQFRWYRGSQWKILSRDFCEFVTDRTSRLVQQATRFWRWACCPDENFFQTLIMNSSFRGSVVPDCKREVVWPGPKVLTMADYDRLKGSSAFFARKFDMDIDRPVLEHLAADLR